MLFSLLLCSLVCTQVLGNQANGPIHWAVLVAGSSGWENYRHQADVCHAYQLLLRNKIPPSNIITMMYDDVARNPHNCYPGQLFNDYKHRDVYRGVQVDYRRDEVTPETFLRVLLGDPELKKAGKKVLESGPEDNVFIFFTDHGAQNLLAFPYAELHARELQETLKKMYEQNRYKNMVLYIEACYSGSMFENLLPTNMSIFVTTAANAHESSWASFCNDPKIHTCLADEYSYTWMSDSETHDLNYWTLDDQFQFVKRHVPSSHVMEYGDKKLSNMPVASFQAGGKRSLPDNEQSVATKDSRPAIQAHLVHLMHQVKSANSPDEMERAHRHLHRALEVPEVAQELRKLDQLCKQGYEVEKIVQVIFDVCS
ncbi:unnamed protein product [Echinostoma caproni]|uniref:Hemoglobinase n=1 Tax=Echinostoma caproni TaxID=27848 RepID=A0A183AG55_9TREM|nr:unnamed protein product [Echinostoma caproni]